MKDLNLAKFFEPLNTAYFSVKEKWQSTQIGYLIESLTDIKFPDLSYCEIAIFNVNEYNGSSNEGTQDICKIRKNLYALHVENMPRIKDLGNLKLENNRKQNFDTITDVCYILMNNGTLPILLGGGHDIVYAMYKAQTKFKKKISYTCIDNKFDIGLVDDKLSNQSHLSKIIKAKPNYLYNYTNLAYQSFFVSPHAVKMLETIKFSYLRLGDIRKNISSVEPILRDSNMLSLDISSISSAYAKANNYCSPNGLNGNEICKLLFYAGVSDKLKSFGIFEYNQNLDQDDQTAKLISQIIWYFLEGFQSRVSEEIPSSKNLIFYNVTGENDTNNMVFCKSKLSNRWWIVMKKEHRYNKLKVDQFFACSYSDYELAMNGDIPDTWLRIIKLLS